MKMIDLLIRWKIPPSFLLVWGGVILGLLLAWFIAEVRRKPFGEGPQVWQSQTCEKLLKDRGKRDVRK